MSKNDGGPAFPRSGFWADNGPCPTDTEPQGGMALRDYFAGQALAGQLAGHVTGAFDAENTSLVAYEIADAMLAAREAK